MICIVNGKTGPVITYARLSQNILPQQKKIKIETPVRKLQREKIKACNDLTKASNLSSFPDSPPYLAIVTVESGTGNWPSGDGFSSIALKLQTSPLSAHSSLPRMNAFPELIPIIRQ